MPAHRPGEVLRQQDGAGSSREVARILRPGDFTHREASVYPHATQSTGGWIVNLPLPDLMNILRSRVPSSRIDQYIDVMLVNSMIP